MDKTKEYIVASLTYEGLAGEACEGMSIYPTFDKALEDYERAKDVIGNGCYDSFVRLYVRHGDIAYLIRAYCPDSQACIDTYRPENWNGCEMIREESELRI